MELPSAPELLLGLKERDDAAVYRFAPDRLLVQTVDFLTPIVDDPYTFGRIAAANALSDIYAMGAEPLLALNLVAYPSEKWPLTGLREILRGGLQTLKAAGVLLAGGHTVRDNELKYGLAVTGTCKPGELWRKEGAQPGDALILTKPLGTGVIATALKRGQAPSAAVRSMVDSMVALNKSAADILHHFQVHSATDVTGFGLAGHLLEMLSASGVSARLFVDKLEWLPGALELAEARIHPGACTANRNHVAGSIVNLEKIPPAVQTLLWDPQTSGGLLAALPGEAAPVAVQRLRAAGVSATLIGQVEVSTPQTQLVLV